MINTRCFYSFLFLFFATAGTLSAQQEEDTTRRAVPDTTLQRDSRLPVLSLAEADFDGEMQSQDISGLLQSSRDVFTSIAGFTFGNARFRMRGLGSENTTVMINGMRMNDMETGWASWSTWGGLNDVTRWMEVRAGLGSSRFAFGGIGGYSNIDARASAYRKGNRVSYAYSNRSYVHRIMATGSTGMMANGWAVTASASRRYADEGYVEGTFYDGWSYFLSAEKKINERHSIGFVGFGASTKQGRQALAVQEAYDLADNNYYNPNWGYQSGKKRNARVSNNHEPVFMLNHYWKLNEKTRINSGAFVSPGQSGISGLNWYDARDPRPDYYRYLPSFFSERYPDQEAAVTSAWQNDVNARQINWDNLYFSNRKNLYTVYNANGVNGQHITGNRSKYVVEELRNDVTMTGLNSVIQSKLNDKFYVSGGINYTYHRGHNYRKMVDLLGGDFWVDVDNFAEQNFNNDTIAQNDLDNPNRIVQVGDSYGYDYYLNIHRAETFGQLEYSSPKIDAYGAVTLSTTAFWRTSSMRNGRFPENSAGRSETQAFLNYGLKAGATYKLTGRHYFSANVAYLTRAPQPRAAFVSPRTRDLVVSNLKDEEIISADLSYVVRYPGFKARLSGYYTQVNNQTWLRSFYHDAYRTFVNYVMTGVNHLYMGTELGLEINIGPSLVFSGAAAYGQYLWNSRPQVTITRDNATELLADNRTVYLKNYRVGGMPQTALSGGLRYNGTKNWFVGVNFNYFADMYLDPNPDRRTVEAVENFVITDPQWSEVLDQTKLKNGYTLDAFGGKSWRIKEYYLTLNLTVNNVLNNRELVTGGFEQLRYDVNNIDRFPPKLGYMFGTTYFAMVSLRF